MTMDLRQNIGMAATPPVAGDGTRSSARRLLAVAPNLSNLELEILGKLVNGEAVSLSSQQPLRLEVAGAIRDGAQGIAVTAGGRRLASQMPADSTARADPTAASKLSVDKRGRRMPLQRKSIF
jgi:hypothetical protein